MSAPIGQNIKLGHIIDLVHRQLLMHLAVAYILVECTNHGGRMDVWDVVLHSAEPLDVLAQLLSFLLGDDVQVAHLAMSLMASSEGANKLMAQI